MAKTGHKKRPLCIYKGMVITQLKRSAGEYGIWYYPDKKTYSLRGVHKYWALSEYFMGITEEQYRLILPTWEAYRRRFQKWLNDPLGGKSRIRGKE